MNVAAIDRRLNAVAALTDNTVGRQELRLAMTGMGDMERLISRIVYGTAGARDLVNLRAALEHLPEVKRCLTPFRTGALGKLDEQLETLEDISGRIAAVLVDEPPFSVREGGMIREGYDDEVDRLRGILSGGKGFIAQLEAREKEKTGIRTLKVGYNKVFGYYIEVSNSFKDQVPADYIRKQTLVNGERYITQELKDLEHEVLTAHDRDAALEYDLFAALRTEAAGQVTRVQLAGIADRAAGHAVRLCRGGGPEPLLPAGGGRVRGHRDHGRTPSGGGKGAGRRILCAQRHPHGRKGGPGGHHHRSQHGR